MIENDAEMQTDLWPWPGWRAVCGQRPDGYRGDHRAPLSEQDAGWSAVLLVLACCLLAGGVGCAAFGWPLS